MMKRVVTPALAVAMVLGMSGVASAQVAPQTTTMPTYELSAGYQLLRAGEICADDDDENCAGGTTFPFGLQIDAVRNYGAFGIVGEVGWAYDSDEVTFIGQDVIDRTNHLFHFAGGVRWTGRQNPRIWPYGQVLAGAAVNRFSQEAANIDVSDTSTHFMLQPGVGVTFVSGDGWGIVTQVDYRRLFLDEDEDLASGRNDVRVYLGVRMILD